MKLRASLLLVAAIASPACAHAAAAAPERGATIVLMPFENLAGSEQAGRAAWELFAAAIEKKGWRVAERQQLETILEEERARDFDSLDAQVRASVIEGTAGSAIVTGAVYTYTEGREPVVAVSARMVRADGTLAWGDVAGLAAQDTERVLGFGRDENAGVLLEKLVRKMMERFPTPSSETAPVRGREKPLLLPGAISYRAPDVDPMRPHKVCVLPFQNLSDALPATRVVSDVLAVRLAAASGFEVVEPADLRRAALEAGVATFRDVSNAALARLAPLVGTTLFLKGTIYDYAERAGNGGSDSQIQMEITLVDVEQERVVWAAQHVRSGNDYMGLFMLGAVSNAVSLTDRVVAEMIEAGTRPAPRGQAAVTAGGARRVPEKHSALRSGKGEKQ